MKVNFIYIDWVIVWVSLPSFEFLHGVIAYKEPEGAVNDCCWEEGFAEVSNEALNI